LVMVCGNNTLERESMTPGVAGQVKLSYWIDSSGKVLRIDGPWNTWLGQDGELPQRSTEANVVGNSLFSFIESEGVRHIYRVIHKRVLETGEAVEFPFRCDSAWLKREMQMKIARDGDELRYDSVVIKETRRERPLPQGTAGAKTLVAMCSFCKRYRFPVESKKWNDIEFLSMVPELPDLVL